MALSRPDSLLPSIKCSSCASEIAISMMGDHICVPVQESEPFSKLDFFGRDAGTTVSADTRTSPQKSVRAQPLARIDSIIDSIGANKPFLGHKSPTARSPLRVGSIQSSSFQSARGRSAQPDKKSAQRRPSPELSPNLDCAFPHFPSPSYEAHQFSNGPGSDMNSINNGKAYSPWSKNSEGRGASPGSFDVKVGGLMGGKEESAVQREQLKKAATHDYLEKPWQRYEASPDRDRRPSLAKDNRRPAMVDDLPRTDTIDAFLTKLKGGAAPQSRRRIDESKESVDFGPEPSKEKSSIEISRANMDEPVTLSGYPVYKPPTKTPQPKQSENQGSKRPMHRRGLSSDPRYPPRNSSISGVRFDQTKDQQHLPPLPLPPFSLQKPSFASSNGSPHTPTDSGSDDSNGSFDYRNVGSVSSPATSVGSSRSEKRSDYSSGGEVLKFGGGTRSPRFARGNPRPDPEVQFELNAFAFERSEPTLPPNKHKKQGASVHFRTPSETSLPSSKTSTPGLPKPQQFRKLRDIVSEKIITSDRSADPAIQAGLRRKQDMADTVLSVLTEPAAPPSGVGGTGHDGRLGFGSTHAAGNPSLLALPVRSSPSLRSPTATKSDCRGCGKAIVGKSVKAADGSLTGRFHKQCFVCKRCSSPFQTADFYVLNDSPYCGRHYHELNDSLCRVCDQGIEGQYLETDEREKYHPRCFTCSGCPTVLEDDYYEVNGKAYCEPHAFRAAGTAVGGGNGYGGVSSFGTAGNRLLGVGGPTTRVERRRTKLMMI